jgi:hypothetical protein
MKTATECAKILGCHIWNIALIAHRQKWEHVQVRTKGAYGKVVFKYNVSEQELEKYKKENVPMPPYRMTDADSYIQRGLFLHLGVMDIPQHWYEQNANASKVRIDPSSSSVNANFKPIVRRYMRADTDSKIAMMNRIKYLMQEKGIVKTVRIYEEMLESNEIIEVEKGKLMARNTFYMYANQARRELIQDGN